MHPNALIECVPNFSEGRDLAVIRQITDEIESVTGIKLLDVDPGAATNRTVVTFVGHPDQVIEAAFRAIKKAKSLIDMRGHKGEHPRFGATDVCPLIPISGISMEETASYAHKLAERVGSELNYPVYLYEKAATSPQRQNLAEVRSGEYEGLAQKLSKPEWKPDYGPALFVAETGASAIGARDFLIALNFNLNTTSVRRANAIAFDVRKAGRLVKQKDPQTGLEQEVRVPGTLKAAKAIGWFIDEYGIAQVSMNLTNISITSVHEAFEAVNASAQQRGMRVSGTEIVGLVPLKVLTDAGKFYLRKQERSLGVPDSELIKIAVKSLGLDDLKPFNPKEKVIEYQIAEHSKKRLIDLTIEGFALETASESPAPGGGSVAAVMGAMGAALATMVANLSSHKRGWDDKWEYFSQIAEKCLSLQQKLTYLVDADTDAFNQIMDAFSLPKATQEEKDTRKQAIENATKNAVLIPLDVMEAAVQALPLAFEMAEKGNPNSVSDAGVSALALRGAVLGAGLNVKINAGGLNDKEWANAKIQLANELEKSAQNFEAQILKKVNEVMGQ